MIIVGMMNLHLTLMHSELPKLHRVLAALNAIGLRCKQSVVKFANSVDLDEAAHLVLHCLL